MYYPEIRNVTFKKMIATFLSKDITKMFYFRIFCTPEIHISHTFKPAIFKGLTVVKHTRTNGRGDEKVHIFNSIDIEKYLHEYNEWEQDGCDNLYDVLKIIDEVAVFNVDQLENVEKRVGIQRVIEFK
jgi:hypothetical protein